ncbi:MAG: YihY/virulence factor BrkB family protein [Acidimicrobiia bacterium]
MVRFTHHLADKTMLLGVLRATWDRFSRHRGGTLAAAIGYRAVFALAPLLLVAVSLTGVIFGEDAARGELVAQLQRIVGADIAKATQDLVLEASRSRNVGWIGLLLLIWAGSGLFVETQGALASIYEVDPAQVAGFKMAIRRRAVTLAAVIASGVMLAVLVGGATAVAWLPVRWAANGLGFLISAGVLVAGLVLAFRYLTVARLPWRAIILAAVATSVAVGAAAVGVSLFVAWGGGGGASGVAGSLVAILLAVYVLSSVLLLGAALTKTVADRMSTKLSRL